jgi:hypothetical protein
MWLARILGKVTWAQAATPGSSASNSRDGNFKTGLTENKIAERPHRWIRVKVSGKITISEETAYLHSLTSAGRLFVDYLMRGRFHSIPRQPRVVAPDDLSALTASAPAGQNPKSAGSQVPGAVVQTSAQPVASDPAISGLREMKVAHE